jgi:hypothetical protein
VRAVRVARVAQLEAEAQQAPVLVGQRFPLFLFSSLSLSFPIALSSFSYFSQGCLTPFFLTFQSIFSFLCILLTVSPSVMVGSFQSAGMVGKLSAPTMSTSYRGFAGKMNLYNGNLGLYSSASSSSQNSTSSSNSDSFASDADDGGSARKMASVANSKAAFYIGDGRPPEDFFRETVMLFATVIGLLLLFALAQYWYYHNISQRRHKKILHLGWVSHL